MSYALIPGIKVILPERSPDYSEIREALCPYSPAYNQTEWRSDNSMKWSYLASFVD